METSRDNRKSEMIYILAERRVLCDTGRIQAKGS